MKVRKSIIRLIVLLLLACLAGGPFVCKAYTGAWFPFFAKEETDAAKQKSNKDRTFDVKRDDLVIGLVQSGYINANKKHKMSLQANYKTKILWVIDENSQVKKDDVLIRFETDELKETIDKQTIELDNLNKELSVSYEEEKILMSTNDAELQQAKESLLQAEDALRKYRRFERVSQRDSLELAISNAETAVLTAWNTYRDKRTAQNDSSSDETELQKAEEAVRTAKNAIEKAENDLTKANDNLKVFRKFDNPSKITRLVNALDQAKLNLRKVEISTKSKVVQKQRGIENLKTKIDNTEKQLARYKEYMEMMIIKAPVDGVVIYSDPDRRWGQIDVKPGLEVWKGQVLITIPEMTNLVVDFDLPEQYHSKVKVGDKTILYPDSLPGRKFDGEISKISTLPVNMINWDPSSPKVYKSRITLNRQSKALVNGMSTQINIVTKIIPQTLFIPVEAVFDDNGRYYVYRETLSGPEETDVKIGESNDLYVQIVQGLSDGDTVLLYRPYQNTTKVN